MDVAAAHLRCIHGASRKVKWLSLHSGGGGAHCGQFTSAEKGGLVALGVTERTIRQASTSVAGPSWPAERDSWHTVQGKHNGGTHALRTIDRHAALRHLARHPPGRAGEPCTCAGSRIAPKPTSTHSTQRARSAQSAWPASPTRRKRSGRWEGRVGCGGSLGGQGSAVVGQQAFCVHGHAGALQLLLQLGDSQGVCSTRRRKRGHTGHNSTRRVSNVRGSDAWA